MSPSAALSRTVGRGGVSAVDDARRIDKAAPGASQDMSDFLQGRFTEKLFDASGKYTPRAARIWMRNNAEALNQFP